MGRVITRSKNIFTQKPVAPPDAQKNSDITKAEIEAKLTGEITTHTHSGLSGSGTGNSYMPSGW